jgi:HSP20 family molecular chaperone IbpA
MPTVVRMKKLIVFDDLFASMDATFAKMDSLFSDVFADTRSRKPSVRSSTGYEIADEDGVRSITVEVPGCGPEDVDVSLESGILSVRWTEGRGGALDFRIGKGVAPESLSAKVAKGVLRVAFPRSPDAPAAKVKVT